MDSKETILTSMLTERPSEKKFKDDSTGSWNGKLGDCNSKLYDCYGLQENKFS